MATPRVAGLARRGLHLLSSQESCNLQASSRQSLYLTSQALMPWQATVATSARPFSSSSILHKKRKIAAAPNSPGRSSPDHAPSSPSSSSPGASDPLDFSSLVAAYAPIDTHFKSQLQSVLHGGRFNPDSLGALAVSVKPDHGPGASSASESFPLRELAQVVPRSGRKISLLVNDRAYIKPIMSAIQASREFNQQPQRAEDNDLELLLRVELERKDELVRRVKEATQAWRERVRQARTKHDKVLKDGRKTGALLPDVVKRAEKELQKVQDKKMKEIDGEEAQTIKQLDRN